MYCNEILVKENNAQCDGVFWVKSRSHPTSFSSRRGIGWKFDLQLSDKTGELRLTYFEDDKTKIDEKFNSIPKNSFIKVVGVKNIWNNYHSITVGGFTGGLLEPVTDGQFDTSHFVIESNQDIHSLSEEIKETINEMEEGPLKTLMTKFMEDPTFFADFTTKPGAIMYHHACKGGLLEHTWEVLSHCKTTVSVHNSLNKDLVFAGAILHDIGKIREITVSEGGFESTEEGALLGHIALGKEMVTEKINQIDDFPISLKNHLFHIILSHHEKLEYGSPVKAMTPEAIAVACADAIGAKVSQYIRAVKDSGTDENKFYVNPIGIVYKFEDD